MERFRHQQHANMTAVQIGPLSFPCFLGLFPCPQVPATRKYTSRPFCCIADRMWEPECGMCVQIRCCTDRRSTDRCEQANSYSCLNIQVKQTRSPTSKDAFNTIRIHLDLLLAQFLLTSGCGMGQVWWLCVCVSVCDRVLAQLPRLVLNGLKKSSCLSLPCTGTTGMHQVCWAPSNFFVLFFETSSYCITLASLEFALKMSQPLSAEVTGMNHYTQLLFF